MYKFIKPANPQEILGDSLGSDFISLLKTKWDYLHDETNVFRYKIDKFEERLLDEKYLLQLNPDRGTKRRMPEQIASITQPFDASLFNFNMVSHDEIIFNLVKDGKESNKHSLIVNVSPISRYHTLLCPSLSECLPQVATEDSLIIALDVMFLAQNRDLRIGFNSLWGLASVNHLHYHLFIEPHTLPIESAICVHLKGPLFCFKDYPAPAFCYQINSKESIGETANDVFKVITYFLKNSIAHNLMITRGRGLLPGDQNLEVYRIVLWPRRSSKLKFQHSFNIATCELSGWIPIYDESVYRNLKTENLESELRKWKVDNFDVLCEEVKALF